MKQLKTLLVDRAYEKQFFLDNQNLVYDFMQKNKKYLFLFDSPEDMAQEFFLKLWQVLPTYNNKYKFSTFVNKVLQNYCKNKVRELNAKSNLMYLKCSPECDTPNVFEKIIDENYNALEDFINKNDYNSLSFIGKEFADGKNYEDVKRKYNMDYRKIKKMILKDIENIKEK